MAKTGSRGELLSNLDPETGEKVMELLKAYTERGGVVYSSVEPSETKYASKVVNMENRGNNRGSV